MATIETVNHDAPDTANHVEIRIDDGDNTIRFNKKGAPATEVSLPFTFSNAYALTACLRAGLPPENYAQFIPDWE